jgi:hypothetical protein
MNKRTNEAIGSSTAVFAPAVSSEPIHQQNERKNLFAEPIAAANTDSPSPRTSYVQGKTSAFPLHAAAMLSLASPSHFQTTSFSWVERLL